MPSFFICNPVRSLVVDEVAAHHEEKYLLTLTQGKARAWSSREGKDSDSYRVQEFAELAGVTAKTLRHYDRLGLLRPLRSKAGYRVYGKKDLPRLEQIVALKFLGLPVKQIGRVLDRKMRLAEALWDNARRWRKNATCWIAPLRLFKT